MMQVQLDFQLPFFNTTVTKEKSQHTCGSYKPMLALKMTQI
jgi:hypothetical protein